MAAKPATRSPMVFVAGAYAVLIIGFLALAVFPWIRDARAADSDIQKYQRDIAARQDKTRQLADIKHQIKVISAETLDYARLVPPDEDFAFLEDLSRQFDAAGMRDLSKQAMGKTVLGRSQKLPIELRGKGTYDQVHKFLTRLEKLPRLCSVGKLSIDAETDMSGNVDLHLILYIYSAKPTTGS